MIRLDYLTHAMQPDTQSHQSPEFLFQAAQARELAQKILALCDSLESAPVQHSGFPKH